MASSRQSSLLTSSDASSIATSLEWINSVLFGQIAIGLCVLAVAFVGFLMLSGRLPLREGLRVILGCFVLFGAPLIAAGFVGGTSDRSAAVPEPVAPAVSEALPPRGELPPAEYDPYAGASLRRE